jgi:hypothetical protein
MSERLKLIYKTKKGERVYDAPGNRCEGDRRIFIGSPYDDSVWAHTYELIGFILREKAKIEDHRYHLPHHKGAVMLLEYIARCMFDRHDPIIKICKRYKIP